MIDSKDYRNYIDQLVKMKCSPLHPESALLPRLWRRNNHFRTNANLKCYNENTHSEKKALRDVDVAGV